MNHINLLSWEINSFIFLDSRCRVGYVDGRRVTTSGESHFVTPEMVNVWSETSLPTLLYNYDVFGLFYQCVPNKTYQLKSEKCSGGKLSKVRITGMASANAAGDKILMFVIGKARIPRCFKNANFLPCKDHAHPHIENLKAITIVFSTSITQPIDQGVISSLKAKYRTNMVRKVIRSLEKNKTLPKISLLRGMQMLVSAWNANVGFRVECAHYRNNCELCSQGWNIC